MNTLRMLLPLLRLLYMSCPPSMANVHRPNKPLQLQAGALQCRHKATDGELLGELLLPPVGFHKAEVCAHRHYEKAPHFTHKILGELKW